MKTKLKLSDITIDQAIAIRVEIDEDTVQRYQDSLEQLPPIVVFHVDSKYLLADGFHRRAAAIRKGWDDIEAEVKEGTHEEAIEFAIYANLKHGKPLTKAEYEKAVYKLWTLHPKWGSRKIAKAIQRSEAFVRFLRDEKQVVAITGERHLSPKDKAIYHEIRSAPKKFWKPLVEAATAQGLSRAQIKGKVRRIKAKPEDTAKILSVTPEVEPAEGQKLTQAKQQKSTKRTKTDFSSVIDPGETKDLEALKEKACQSSQQVQQTEGQGLYHLGKYLAEVKELQGKGFRAFLEKSGIDPHLAFRAMTWAKEVVKLAAQTGGDRESLAASQFSESSFWERESSKQLSAEEQLKRRYSWDGISDDMENGLQRVIQAAQRLPDGELPKKAPLDDLQKLRYTLTQGRTICSGYLDQLEGVEDVSSDV